MSARPVWATAGAVSLLVLVTLVYTSGLGTSPPYLMHDELQFSLQARAIAETGRDLSGRRMPVFFTEPEFPPGRDPVIIYVTAAALQVLPFSHENVKRPTALVGVLNVALMFVLGRALFGSVWWGLVAALLLAFTPIHFMRSRLVLSPFYSLPFILGWLIALAAYLRTGSRRALLTGTALIAASTYSYLACMVMAPVYFAITLFVATKREGVKVAGPMAMAAALVLAPMLIWYATHPERYGQLVEAYRLFGSTASTPLVPVTSDDPSGLRLWVGLLWRFLSPDFLFLSGDSSVVNSTRAAGLFPVAFAVLIAAGSWTAVRSKDALTRVIVVGLVTAPLASIVSGAIEMNRIMFAIPFAALVAAIGAVSLVRRGGAARVTGVLLLLAVPLQFASFHRDYLHSYPTRAGSWFGGNVRDAVLTATEGTAPAFVSAGIPFGNRYAAFYVPAHRRGEVQIVRDVPGSAPSGARAACMLNDSMCGALRADGNWRQIAAIDELSGEELFAVFERR